LLLLLFICFKFILTYSLFWLVHISKDQSSLPQHFYRMLCVIFCSSVADSWPGSNWRFCSNPFLIVTNATFITGTIFDLTFHILLISVSRIFVSPLFSSFFCANGWLVVVKFFRCTAIHLYRQNLYNLMVTANSVWESLVYTTVC
jgi:hypothetical protein